MKSIASKKPLIIGVLAMAVIVITSNILVQFFINDWLTWGAFIYPIAFLITDLMNRFYGPKTARKVIIVGFSVGVVCSLIGSQIYHANGPYVTLRIALGSGAAFLISQLIDVKIFDLLRRSIWWKAPLISSMVGASIDTFAFFSIAFSSQLAFLEPAADVAWANTTRMLFDIGPEFPYWVSMAIADNAVKQGTALLMLFPFRALSLRFKAYNQTPLNSPVP